MEEELKTKTRKLIDDYGYKSAKFRLALVKEGSLWKILIAQIILDISEPKKNKTHVKEENFALEDICISIEEFRKFLDYLAHVYIGDISPQGEVTINKKLQFTLENYDLCFVGNFPSKELYFHGRKFAKEHGGFDKPFFLADYAIHQSVAPKSHPKLDLTGAEIPLRNASEAINYFWGTHFDEQSLRYYCQIYMPFFEASISDFKLNENELILKFDIEKKLAKLEDLYVGIIAEKKPEDYRKKHLLKENKLEIDLGFKPNLVNVYLYHKGKKIDEYDFYDYRPIEVNRPFLPGTRTDFGSMEDYEGEQTLLPLELISKLPNQIQSLLIEAENAFKAGLFRATILLFRSAIEEGVILLLKQIEKEEEVYDDKKFEVGLGKKIRILTEYMPSLRQVKKELEHVKWFGDKASHKANMPFDEQDISNILEPELRLILTKFVEEVKQE